MDEGVDWSEVNEQLHDFLSSAFHRKDLVIYNAEYDVRLVNQTCKLHNLNSVFGMPLSAHVTCAMIHYAEHWGQESSFGSYKWQSLVNACAQQNVKVRNAHRAVADCQMTLDLLKAVWAK